MMDPVSIGLTAIGFGMQLFGGMSASKDAKEAAQLSSQNATLEGQVNQQRAQQMELSARRQQMEIYRNSQRARAQGIEAAVSQNAQFGSGLPGAFGQNSGQTGVNLLGVNQNLQIGRNIFGINQQISGNNAQIAQVKGQQAQDQSWASLGGSIVSDAGKIGNIFGGGKSFSNIGNSFFGGGSPSGYGTA